MWDEIRDLFPIIIAVVTGIIIIYYTKKIYEMKSRQAEVDKELAETNQKLAAQKLVAFKEEVEYKKKVFKQVKDISMDIAHEISQQLIENQTWLDRFMDETGATYSGSVFGRRIRHFFYEKKSLAKTVVNEIESCFGSHDSNYCLLIDSGTTLYPIFHEIATRIKKKENIQAWKERVCIITNNLPGVQYFMKNCRDDPTNNYSEIAINCFLIPGKPLSVYGAITGKESEEWISSRIDKFLREELKWKKNNYKILGFVTGNYMAAKWKDRTIEGFYPVARGEGHVEIKRKFVKASDKIFLISPLMKFSFADVHLLNHVNEFTIKRNSPDARDFPRKVKYELIEVAPEKCVYITTSRNDLSQFHQFSRNLIRELRQLYRDKNVIANDFDLRDWIPAMKEKDHGEIEIEKEIPHENLREKYRTGKDIWDIDWVEKNLI
jgi:hypothetical protein